ncbi:NirD/YgiW/YdeI family stress tolerance protein [Phaeovibrio sulfidiphilus]|uniref:NirD/YgiW/YdeI family stress tolerance protein n=1 Tax=Phaeovibrio sulfidiphilus TaxID=1220600 RepID=A0A8J6YN72_9PROT|nr:NirD/YgiW/YdeI family stress tolerance protein [Phaeovibrio sulfidiphilus]MBE1237750.1 NirD/YgiW/YdeI family stress tolerance protein [Phaeovibrio sulfidiphilus]
MTTLVPSVVSATTRQTTSRSRTGVKTLAAAFLAACTLAGASQAHAQQGYGNGYGNGYTAPAPAVVTVEQAKTMADDTWVSLQGRIVKPLGGKDYLFQDDSGTTNIEVDRHAWNGLQVAPTDMVEIQGKVERKHSRFKEIEVKRIILLSAPQGAPTAQPTAAQPAAQPTAQPQN